MVRVAVLEAFETAMQIVIRGHVGDGLGLIFPASNSDIDRAAALLEADYGVVCGVRMPPPRLNAARKLLMMHQWAPAPIICRSLPPWRGGWWWPAVRGAMRPPLQI